MRRKTKVLSRGMIIPSTVNYTSAEPLSCHFQKIKLRKTRINKPVAPLMDSVMSEEPQNFEQAAELVVQ